MIVEEPAGTSSASTSRWCKGTVGELGDAAARRSDRAISVFLGLVLQADARALQVGYRAFIGHGMATVQTTWKQQGMTP